MNYKNILACVMWLLHIFMYTDYEYQYKSCYSSRMHFMASNFIISSQIKAFQCIQPPLFQNNDPLLRLYFIIRFLPVYLTIQPIVSISYFLLVNKDCWQQSNTCVQVPQSNWQQIPRYNNLLLFWLTYCKQLRFSIVH